MEYARCKVIADSKLYKAGKDGKTLLETLQVVEKMTGRQPEELKQIIESVPPMPASLSYVWDMFQKLSKRRTVGMQSNPITYPEITYFCTLYNITLTQLELEAIELLDAIILTDPDKLEKGDHDNQH